MVAPAAPTGLVATAGDAQVALDWQDNTEGDLAGYNVYRSTTSGGPFTTPVNGTLLTTSNYTDTGRTNGTTYYYVVTAADNSANESVASAQASATPSVGGGGTVTVTYAVKDDCWVLESTATSNVGGTIDTKGDSLRVGDDSGNRQYKAIVSFRTKDIPDGATILSATLKVTRQNVAGSVAGLGTLAVDVGPSAGFGNSTKLEVGDFQAAAAATGVATMSIPSTDGGLSTGSLNSAGCLAINKTGYTQFRLYFTTADNGNGAGDYISFESRHSSPRPELVITYQP
jgi:hypothetical protein